MGDGFREYLTALVSENSLRDAAELLGYSRRSECSVSELCRMYGVEPPARKNQHHECCGKHHVDADTDGWRVKRVNVADGVAVDTETAVVLSDIHYPFQDDRAVSIALAVVQDMVPDTIYLAGDIVDFYAVSRFSKDPHRELQLQDELDSAIAFLAKLRSVAPGARIVYIEGNHEARLRDYLIDPQRRALSSLRDLSIERQLHLDEFGIEYVGSRARTSYETFGVIKVGHFNKVAKYSAYTAKNLMDQYMCSLVQGHTHRLGTHYRTVSGQGTYVAAENGCLCDTDPEYASEPDWAHGFTVITKIVGSNRFHLQQVPIVDYEAFYDGIRYVG